jgi:hypothetical protein
MNHTQILNLQGFEYIRKIQKYKSNATGPNPPAAQWHSVSAAGLRSARGLAGPGSASASAARAAHSLAQLGPARARARARAVAQHACSAAVTSPVHGRRRGEKHGGASPTRGRRRYRNSDVDDGARMARRGVDDGAAGTARECGGVAYLPARRMG